MSFFQFLKTKKAWSIVFSQMGLYIALLLMSWFALSWYTGHGNSVTIPEVKGKKVGEAKEILEALDLEVIVIDSVWSDTATKGSIRDISPEGGTIVKEGRKIFLTIFRSTPPMETMNIQVGEYAEVAKIKLDNKGITYDVEIQPNNNFVGSLIAIKYNGRNVVFNEQLPRGTRVQLIIGEADETTVPIPDLFGMNYIDAVRLLRSLRLQDQLFFDVPPSATDSIEYKVCRQEPPFSKLTIPVTTGSIVDIYLSKVPCERDSTYLLEEDLWEDE